VVASNVDFLCMQSKSFRLHSAERANNHVEQDHPVLFTGNPIGIAHNQLSAMFTRTAHKSS
jgi:hypothetical protein